MRMRENPDLLAITVPDTCEVICYALKEKVLLVPSEENWRRVADDFETRCQFPMY